MKVLWIILGVLLGLCLVCAGGGYFLFNKAKGVFTEAGTFGDESFRAVSITWDAKEFAQRAAPDIEQVNGKDAIPNLMKKLSSGLGPMKSFTSHLVGVNSKTDNGSSATTASWIADANFEKGSGLVNMTLISRQGKWQILKFDVNAPTLLLGSGPNGVGADLPDDSTIKVTTGGSG